MALNPSTAAKNDLLSGDDIKTTYTNSQVVFYSGTKPTSADEAPGADTTKLATFTGVNFDAAADGEMDLTAEESATTVAAGVASWFRITITAGTPDTDDTSTKTQKRWDGSLSNSGGGDLNGNTVNFASGQSVKLLTTIKWKFA